jgi:hypothetical protein
MALGHIYDLYTRAKVMTQIKITEKKQADSHFNIWKGTSSN